MNYFREEYPCSSASAVNYEPLVYARFSSIRVHAYISHQFVSAHVSHAIIYVQVFLKAC